MRPGIAGRAGQAGQLAVWRGSALRCEDGSSRKLVRRVVVAVGGTPRSMAEVTSDSGRTGSIFFVDRSVRLAIAHSGHVFPNGLGRPPSCWQFSSLGRCTLGACVSQWSRLPYSSWQFSSLDRCTLGACVSQWSQQLRRAVAPCGVASLAITSFGGQASGGRREASVLHALLPEMGFGCCVRLLLGQAPLKKAKSGEVGLGPPPRACAEARSIVLRRFR